MADACSQDIGVDGFMIEYEDNVFRRQHSFSLKYVMTNYTLLPVIATIFRLCLYVSLYVSSL
jgi:hypothetical protein